MPIPFTPIPPAEASDGSRFCDPLWQRWLMLLNSAVSALLKQALLKSDGGTVQGDMTLQGKLTCNSTVSIGAATSITGNVSITGNETVSGTITCTSVTQTSDERLKHRWRRLPTSFVEQLAGLKKKNRSGTFGWRTGGSRAAGTSAQEVERFCPTVVFKGDDGLKRIDYGVLGVLSAVELAERLLKAEECLRQLESNLTELQDRIGQSEWREGRR